MQRIQDSSVRIVVALLAIDFVRYGSPLHRLRMLIAAAAPPKTVSAMQRRVSQFRSLLVGTP